jgi:hypothetical protein
MENFTILSFEDGHRIRQNQKLQVKYQMPDNYAIIYETVEQQILLFPAKGNKVVLFPNEQIMNEIIQKSGIPIETDNFFAKHKEFILNWESNLNQSLSTLSTKIQFDLGKPFQLNDINTVSEKLTILLKGMSKEDIYELYSLPFAALLGKIIIENNDRAEWKLYKFYDVNPYFVPDVAINGKQANIFKVIGDEMVKKKVSLTNCLKRIGIKV